VARELRDAAPDSYTKKFDTKIEAEGYIKDFKFQIVKNTQCTNDNFKGVKKKKCDNPCYPISSLKDHIKKVFFVFMF